MNDKRFRIAKLIALPSTVCCVIAWATYILMGDNFLNEFLVTIGMIGSLVSYMFAGLVTVIQMALGIAKWGWLLIPVFPIDLLVLIVAFCYALFALFFLPIIPVCKAEKKYRQ